MSGAECSLPAIQPANQVVEADGGRPSRWGSLMPANVTVPASTVAAAGFDFCCTP